MEKVSSYTIRGAGSLFIFIEGPGTTIQKYCAKIKMDRTLVGFSNIHQAWLKIRSEIN